MLVISRLPFLWLGYGEDPDTWRVARSASTLWESGLYETSRMPGYPLHEIISSPIIGIGGAPLSNAFALLIGLLLVVVWKQIARD